MKDYRACVNNGEELVQGIRSLGYDCETVEGALVDSYFFETDGGVKIRGAKGAKINRIKPRKYIMILDHFLNTWSSNHEIILTDSEQEFEETLESYRKDYKERILEEMDTCYDTGA